MLIVLKRENLISIAREEDISGWTLESFKLDSDTIKLAYTIVAVDGYQAKILKCRKSNPSTDVVPITSAMVTVLQYFYPSDLQHLFPGE